MIAGAGAGGVLVAHAGWRRGGGGGAAAGGEGGARAANCQEPLNDNDILYDHYDI